MQKITAKVFFMLYYIILLTELNSQSLLKIVMSLACEGSEDLNCTYLIILYGKQDFIS